MRYSSRHLREKINFTNDNLNIIIRPQVIKFIQINIQFSSPSHLECSSEMLLLRVCSSEARGQRRAVQGANEGRAVQRRPIETRVVERVVTVDGRCELVVDAVVCLDGRWCSEGVEWVVEARGEGVEAKVDGVEETE